MNFEILNFVLSFITGTIFGQNMERRRNLKFVTLYLQSSMSMYAWVFCCLQTRSPLKSVIGAPSVSISPHKVIATRNLSRMTFSSSYSGRSREKKQVWASGNPVLFIPRQRVRVCFWLRFLRSMGNLDLPQTNLRYI